MTPFQSKSVLIVEPHPGYRKLLHFFAAQAGHQVRAVENLEQAREWLHQGCVDAVLCAYAGEGENLPCPAGFLENVQPAHHGKPLPAERHTHVETIPEFATKPSWDAILTNVTQAVPVIWVSSTPLPANILGKLHLAGHGLLAKPLDPCAVSAALDRALYPDPLEPLSATLAECRINSVGTGDRVSEKIGYDDAQNAPGGYPRAAPPQHENASQRPRVLH